MKTARTLKTPLFPSSLFPVLCISAFSLFVVWQWWTHPIENTSLSHDPLDQAADFRLLSSSNHAGSAGSNGVSNPEDLGTPRRIEALIKLEEEEEEEEDVIREEVDRCCECGTFEKAGRKKKAVSLLHNWTDDELYRRVIKADLRRRKSLASGREIDCSSIDRTFGGRSSLYSLDSGSTEPCSSFCARNNDSGSEIGYPYGKVKIAFLFMITDSLPFEPLWNEFFEGKEGLYNVYVHTDPFKPNLLSKTSPVFWRRFIPSQKAYRGSPSLVLASNRLFANAMLDDQANGYFVLLSGSCIPVRSFDHVYRVITSSKQSFLEQIVNETVMWERYTGREGGEEIMQPEITFDQFRKASQWFIFLRRHALMILQDIYEKRYWSKFDHPCVIYFCGTDEHYYPTFFNIVDPYGVTGTSATYVRWPEYVSEHPVTFYQEDVNQTLIREIQSTDDGQYLFARKFEGDTVDLLMQMVEIILR